MRGGGGGGWRRAEVLREVLSSTHHPRDPRLILPEVPGAKNSGSSMETAGPSQGGQSLCVKHTPEHLLSGKERDVEGAALDLLDSVAVTKS